MQNHKKTKTKSIPLFKVNLNKNIPLRKCPLSMSVLTNIYGSIHDQFKITS